MCKRDAERPYSGKGTSKGITICDKDGEGNRSFAAKEVKPQTFSCAFEGKAVCAHPAFLLPLTRLQVQEDLEVLSVGRIYHTFPYFPYFLIFCSADGCPHFLYCLQRMLVQVS